MIFLRKINIIQLSILFINEMGMFLSFKNNLQTTSYLEILQIL